MRWGDPHRFTLHEAGGAVGTRRCDCKYVRRCCIHKMFHGAEIGAHSRSQYGGGRWHAPEVRGCTNGAEKKKERKKRGRTVPSRQIGFGQG